MCYYIYILFSEKLDKYYRGQTEDLDNRLNRHNSGYEKSTRGGAPWRLVWWTIKPNRAEAVRLEAKLKNLSRQRLILFIQKHTDGVAGPDAPSGGQDADR